ncbi:MAG: DUF1761 domain-containing protein [Candidatus Moraniibacteriota bacterium]
MEIHYTLIIAATVAQFILGALWYSPLLFGKWWMQIMEMAQLSKEEQKNMQKAMAPFYIVQILLTLLSTFVLAMFVQYLQMANVGFHAYGVAGWIWLGFIAPTQIASVIWANTKREYWWKQIFIMTSYQLVGLMMTAWIWSL